MARTTFPPRETLQAAPPEIGGYFLERHDRVIRPDDGEPDVYSIGMLRLVRSHPEIRYEGIVHKRSNDAVPCGELPASCRLRTRHL